MDMTPEVTPIQQTTGAATGQNMNFPEGNLSSWQFFAFSYFPKMIETLEIVHAATSAALQALVGSNFEEKGGNLEFSTVDDRDIPRAAVVSLSYDVPDFELSYASEEAIEHDVDVVRSYLDQVKAINWEQEGSVSIDTEAGVLNVEISLSLSGV